jgi:hypothetical protein
MPVTVVLAVGLDSWLISMHSELWKSQGYIMIPVSSARDAIDHFNAGDFDLVLLGDGIPAGQRERLTSLIRARSSRTPIVSFSDSFASCEPSADAVLHSDPGTLLSGLRELLKAKSTLLARAAGLLNNAI